MTDIDNQKTTEANPSPLLQVSSVVMFRPKPRRRPDLFVSAKAPAARHPALREALVQASLDPRVRSIAHVPTTHVSSAPLDPVEIDAIVLTMDDGRFYFDVVPSFRSATSTTKDWS